jgi:hypothetical protein
VDERRVDVHNPIAEPRLDPRRRGAEPDRVHVASARLSSAAAADALAKVAILSGMIVLINGAWLLVGASVAPLLHKPRSARIANVALAVALVAATAAAVVH